MRVIELGKRIRELREDNKLTQIGLACKLGVDKTIISKWENDRKRPIYEDLISMAEIFGVTVGYLLGTED